MKDKLLAMQYAAAIAAAAGVNAGNMSDVALANEMNILQADEILPPGSALRHGQVCLANESRFNESFFNQPLTAYAVGWRDPNNLHATLDFFAPQVPTSRRFTYAEFVNVEEFYSEQDDERAIGAEFKRVEYKSTKTEGKTTNKGLTIRVDLDEVAERQGWEQIYTAKLMRRLLRNELRRTITLLSAAATNTAKTWDTTAGKDPDQDVTTDLLTATTSSGVRPNRVGYGDTAWDKRRLSHRAQDNAGGYASAAMTPEQVAAFLNVDRVYVSRERYQSSTAAKSEIVSNLVLEFFALDGADTEDPSNVKRFVTPIEGGGMFRVFTQQISAKLYDITVEYYSLVKITSTLALRKLTIS